MSNTNLQMMDTNAKNVVFNDLTSLRYLLIKASMYERTIKAATTTDCYLELNLLWFTAAHLWSGHYCCGFSNHQNIVAVN